MNILLYTDNHFSTYSSIIRKRGEKYSVRLENQIKSLNWIEKLAEEYKCEAVIHLGDFFNNSTLTDEELTALKEVKWSNIPHYFIVGNHESSVNNLKYNSTKVLERNNFYIIDKSTSLGTGSTKITLIPYIMERNRKSLIEYIDKQFIGNSKHIILSHNDIKGIQMGPIITGEGFTKEEILENCDLFINGHIHNGSWVVENRIRNLGNLTGQDFKEDAFKYKHQAMILDTETLRYESFENPYAFNFYKVKINEGEDLQIINTLKNNAVVSFKCNERYADKLKNLLKESNKVVEYRINVVGDLKEIDIDSEDLSIDHLSKFVEFCKEKIENTEELEYELKKICS